MAQPPRHHYSYGDSLRLEEDANVKHQYFEGVIYAMAGGSLDHAAHAGTVIRLLGQMVADRPCRVFSSNARVRVLATGLATYPDVSVVCGPIERAPRSRHTLIDPPVLVEVLSESTEEYDRGEKFERSWQIPSRRAYVLVDSRRALLDVRRRTSGVRG